MATWKAIITGREEVSADNTMTVSFNVLRDEVVILENSTQTAIPSEIQQYIESYVRSYAAEWELAQQITVGEELTIDA